MKKTRKKVELTPAAPKLAWEDYVAPEMVGFESTASANESRLDSYDSGAGGYINFPNIKRTSSPFKSAAGGSRIDVRDAITLCVQAYWAFPLLRNITEIQVEFSNSKIILSGGNKKTNAFIEKWLERINVSKIAERAFREWFRSANVHIYRIDGKINNEEMTKMKQVYGSDISATVPLDYRILNPETIIAGGEYYLNNTVYYKVLTNFEATKLGAMPKKEIKNNLGDGLKFMDLDGGLKTIQLDPKNLTSLLYKAQDYEVAGIPYAYGALEDIEAKLELKRIDLATARTVERTLLHLKVGETPNEYTKNGSNINPNTIAALQNLFNNNSVGRVLVSDYTVNAAWVLPDVQKILGAEKYAQLDKDIAIALNAVIFAESGEKYSNLSIKTKIFFERLKEARNAFINEFLQKEVKRVSQAIGAKNYPKVSFEELSLKDELQFAKMYVSMAQLGMLTVDETVEALQTGKLPNPEESLESQKRFADLKKEGYYMPIVGGASELQRQQIESNIELAENPVAAPKAAGRPSGTTGTPKSSNKVSPRSSKAYSLAGLRELVPIVSDLNNAVNKEIKKQYKVKSLSADQNAIGKMIVEAIISNEPKDEWNKSVASYVKSPKEVSEAALREIEDIQIELDTDSYEAAMLRLTKTAPPE